MNKKIPMRKCLGCMESKPKKELIRIVRELDGSINIDRTGKLNGRSAYFCDSKDCLDKLIKSGRLSKEFEMQISNEMYDEIRKQYN